MNLLPVVWRIFLLLLASPTVVVDDKIMSGTRSEREIIRRIKEQLPAESGMILKGVGDDCAVLRQDGTRLQVLTVDTLVESVHFDLGWHPAELLGRKAAAVNLSDIAAMGATPRFALLSLGVPASLAPEWLDGFMAGFLEALAGAQTVLIGGDTVQSGEQLTMSVTVGGEVAEGEVLYRSGAQVGDSVWVSGSLGEAAAGLAFCKEGKDAAAPAWQQLVKAHLDPEPELALGPLLAASGHVHAMMDLSDGLATYLAHLFAASGVGAEVMAEQLPLSPSLRAAADHFHCDPLDWALKGGEDYRLLFTAPVDAAPALQALVAEQLGRDIYCVGRIVQEGGISLCNGNQRQDISYQGYDHFAP